MRKKLSITTRVSVMACIAAGVWASPASADTLFFEDFEGYTSFPDEKPANDPVNLGVPKISEGAKEEWFGGRFETPDGGSIGSDVAVQGFGGGGNSTHTGRVADDAGLLFMVSTTGYENVKLSFDWRTFSTSSNDRLKVGYTTAALPELALFNSQRTVNFVTELGGQPAAEQWWNDNWVQIFEDGENNTFTNEMFSLPSNEDKIWVAFWLDNGDHDFAKFDDVRITADPMPVIPSPASFAAGLPLLAIAGYMAQKNRR